MIPLKDDNPARSLPLVTVALIVANVAAFVYEILLPPEATRALVASLGVTPVGLTRLDPLDVPAVVRAGMTLFTSMFLHANVPHVALNMLYLWIFGNNVEDVMGHGRFVAFYLLCGAVAAVAQVAAAPSSTAPMIGASGAISGVLGAYLVMFPAARVLTLVFIVLFVRVVAVPAVIVLGIWFLLQLVSAGRIAPGGVAVIAHIGGFLAGVILIPAFRRRRSKQSLF